jgi:putative transposase
MRRRAGASTWPKWRDSFGVSRQTAYVWIRRYEQAGHDVAALEEGSRRPHRHPKTTSETMQAFLVEARKAHPWWGPRKLRAWLLDRCPGRWFPSASCIGMVLKRRGLSHPLARRRREKVSRVNRPFAAADQPNAVWCVDFKGWSRTGDGRKCYPLTIVDDARRWTSQTDRIRKGCSTPPSSSTDCLSRFDRTTAHPLLRRDRQA